MVDYGDEIETLGSEEVKCSMENGKTLRDWEKFNQNPTFTNTLPLMKGHYHYANVGRTDYRHGHTNAMAWTEQKADVKALNSTVQRKGGG